MMHKSRLLLSAVSILLGTSQLAHADEHQVASYQLDAQVALISDERTRGVSDSLMQPALKLSSQFAHESGLLAVLDVVNVSTKEFQNGNGTNVLLAGGYRFGNPEEWHFGVGLAREFLPGAHFSAPHAIDGTGTPVDWRSTGYNTSFAVFEIGYGAIEGRILNVVSQTYRGANTGGVCGSLLDFAPDQVAAIMDPNSPTNQCYARGENNSKGSFLYDLDYKVELAPATTLRLHAGYQKVSNFSEANFADYKIGVLRKQWGLEWNADFVATHTKARELYMYRDGSSVRSADNNALIITVLRRL